MEDDENLVPEPDEKGQVVLSNRAWVRLDPMLWTMATKISKLDLSYNHIVELPPEIGELLVLRELICSFNKIEIIPPELGRCKRLRRLLLNSNRISELPLELGGLDMLEELIASENKIDEFPLTMTKIPNLKVIKLMNNRLKSLPFQLADILTIEEINCENNPQLETIPRAWRGDTESILFICRIHRDYYVQTNEVNEANMELAKHSQIIEQDNLLLREKVLELEAKIDDLNKNMPKKIAQRMEDDAKRARERELALETDGEASKGCVLS